MADLAPFADRHNDIEIANNAPLSATLFRRIGANINFLLDLLNVSDGSNNPIGGGIVEFNTPGTFSYVVQPGLVNHFVTLIGAGGAGGVAAPGNGFTGAGGGGGGGITQTFIQGAAGNSWVVQVGAGSVSQTWPNDSPDGGDTRLITLDQDMYAGGGGGGAANTTPQTGLAPGGLGGKGVIDGAPGGDAGSSGGGGVAEPGGDTVIHKGGLAGATFGQQFGSGGGGASYGQGGQAGIFGSANGGVGQPGVAGAGGGGGHNGNPGGAGSNGRVMFVLPLIT